GPVVDEMALHKALITKKIAGAGLDFMVDEPPSKDSPPPAFPGRRLSSTSESRMAPRSVWRQAAPAGWGGAKSALNFLSAYRTSFCHVEYRKFTRSFPRA